MISEKNFTWRNHPDVATIPVDTEYQRCNFARENPINDGGNARGTRLFPGDDTPRTFIDCNLINCEPPPGSTLDHCNTILLSSPADSSQDTVTLPSSRVMTIKHRVTVYYGQYDHDTESYTYLTSPVEQPFND